jgi:hypothetical protein
MIKSIKVYGERNTNTNYIDKLIALNLNVIQIPGIAPASIRKLQRALPGNELVRDMYFYLAYRHNLGWKHTCVKTQARLNQYKLVDSDLLFLTLTKNPYSWLLSLYRSPYHQKYTHKPCFEAFLQRKWITTGRDNTQGDVASPMALWNIKNQSYLQLDSNRTMNVTTESTFTDPAGIIDNICQRLSIEKKSDKFINYERSTKDKKSDALTIKTITYHKNGATIYQVKLLRLLMRRLTNN